MIIACHLRILFSRLKETKLNKSVGWKKAAVVNINRPHHITVSTNNEVAEPEQK